jgi:hypothetical protein
VAESQKFSLIGKPGSRSLFMQVRLQVFLENTWIRTLWSIAICKLLQWATELNAFNANYREEIMNNSIEGVVERYAPNLCGHGDHGFHVLLAGGNTLFYFSGVRTAYSPLPGRPSNANSALAELMTHGDHISFEIKGNSKNIGYFATAAEGSLRNWTLENRLHGTVKDITPKPNVIDHQSVLKIS